MGEIAHLQPRTWIIVYGASGEPAHDEFFDVQERADAVADLIRMTTDQAIEVRQAFL